MEKWIIIDGNSIANRAFYAMPPLTNSQGLHTNAVYGFTTMLLKLLEEEQPTHIVVAFDAGKITFRHGDYKDYKGGRSKTPSELSEQFPLMKELMEAMGIAQFELSGYEADDIIGTLTRMADEEQKPMMVVSGDKDMLQLASEYVTVVLTRKGVTEIEKYDPAAIEEKYQLKPLQIIDLKGLMGDSSDNIPGVPGVGEKTALKLLHQYGSVESVLEHVGELKGKMKENIENHADDARMSKQLATIYREVPIELEREKMAFEGIPSATALPMLRKLEFKSILERVEKLAAKQSGEEVSAEPVVELALETILVTLENVQELTSALKQGDVDTLVLEAHGDNPHYANFFGLTLGSKERYWHVTKDMLLSEEAAPIRAWLADAEQPKYGYDLHRTELVLHWLGIVLEGAAFDVQLAAYVLDPSDAAATVQSTAAKYELTMLQADEEVYGKGAKFKVPADELVAQHTARKAYLIGELVPLMQQDLQKYEMSKLYYELELPLSSILAQMEKTGIKVNKSSLEKLGEQFTDAIEKTMTRIYELAGVEFNIGSPKQLGEILFDKLGLPVIKKTKTGYSTDAEVLEKLEPYHAVIPLILHYRQMTKLQSTYIEGLLKEVRPDTGRVHTYYRQTIAATGRLSSQFPNLQNIPIRLEEGRQIRQAFVPTEADWSIVAADYSQIELRVLAHISGDEKLKEAFIQDMDIHTKTAMDVFGVKADDVDANMRRSAKAVNFGIVYGISDYGLSQNLNITRKDAAKFIEQYFAVFQGVRQYMEDIVKMARQDGYVKTMLERRRYLPEINASNFNLRSFAERTAMNTPIQGTAADIIKLAMVKMDERMRKLQLKSRMLLQVHDELVFEVPADEVDIMKKLVPEVMEQAIELVVPLKADVSVGTNWYESK
ncbi:DNA polymerase I [Paenibacillus sp. UMB4589-SE434]|uniref:DNA polymerase I n=1 Tax=Paenibacillus sp. UMB4589-SE434 TaxID=3046314 RepID=UPI00254F5A4A|nr:DNA polymerase I [Paenibacillus sp. UMB4589-SE434]MDK8182365.1 DNA polymerase I [Paenibacillus sp. UMB4589-SE434]